MANPSRQLLPSNEVEPFFNLESEFMPKEGYFRNRRLQLLRSHAVASIQKHSKSENFNAFIPYLAMNYFDSYMSNYELPMVIPGDDVTKNFDLFVICCLTTAWKIRIQSFSVTKFLKDRKLKYKNQDLERMEFCILCKLKQWRTPSSTPRCLTPICFVKFFISYMKLPRGLLKPRTVVQIIIRSHYVIGFTSFQPSIVAASAVLAYLSCAFPTQSIDYQRRMSSCELVSPEALMLCTGLLKKWYRVREERSGKGRGNEVSGSTPAADETTPLLDAEARPERRAGKEPMVEEDEEEKKAKAGAVAASEIEEEKKAKVGAVTALEIEEEKKAKAGAVVAREIEEEKKAKVGAVDAPEIEEEKKAKAGAVAATEIEEEKTAKVGAAAPEIEEEEEEEGLMNFELDWPTEAEVKAAKLPKVKSLFQKPPGYWDSMLEWCGNNVCQPLRAWCACCNCDEDDDHPDEATTTMPMGYFDIRRV